MRPCTAHRGRLCLALALLVALASGCGPRGRSPTVVAGAARFEFLTPTLVRLEYAPGGTFVDAPTAVVQKRDWPAVTVASLRRHGWLIASSGALTLRYKLDSGPFTAQNLEITWRTGPRARRWHPGEKDALNLGGLTYSLDNVSTDNLPPGLPARAGPLNDSIPGIDFVLPQPLPGLLSRAGYALLDDSRTPVWNEQRTWIEPRPGAGQDWYVFACGDDLQQPLSAYAALCAPVPMVPRYVLGPMITTSTSSTSRARPRRATRAFAAMTSATCRMSSRGCAAAASPLTHWCSISPGTTTAGTAAMTGARSSHASHEYLFGEQMLVAPVLDPSGDVSIWLPPGQWIDFFSGRRYEGDRRFSAHYALDETPVFVRVGALIPQQEAAPPPMPIPSTGYSSTSTPALRGISTCTRTTGSRSASTRASRR